MPPPPPPPPEAVPAAEFPETVHASTSRSWEFTPLRRNTIPPPHMPVLLSEIVLDRTDKFAPSQKTPPPPIPLLPVELLEMSQAVIVAADKRIRIPPPLTPLLPDTVLEVSVSTPLARIPPPSAMPLT